MDGSMEGDTTVKHIIAERLLEINAVALKPQDPFTWTSGLRSPIYCDNRLTLSFPAVRREIAAGLQKLILENFSEAEVIAGTATAGIPHAAWVSELMDLPMCYVRSKAKGHGKGNQIEGKVEQGQNVVVVEDLISTGGSVITAVQALREAGCDVLGVVSIFTYGLEKGKELLQENGIKSISLTDFPTLIEVSISKGNVTEDDQQSLLLWSKDPSAWSKQFVETDSLIK
jgi:orotate phosphoribosyltransferase